MKMYLKFNLIFEWHCIHNICKMNDFEFSAAHRQRPHTDKVIENHFISHSFGVLLLRRSRVECLTDDDWMNESSCTERRHDTTAQPYSVFALLWSWAFCSCGYTPPSTLLSLLLLLCGASAITCILASCLRCFQLFNISCRGRRWWWWCRGRHICTFEFLDVDGCPYSAISNVVSFFVHHFSWGDLLAFEPTDSHTKAARVELHKMKKKKNGKQNGVWCVQNADWTIRYRTHRSLQTHMRPSAYHWLRWEPVMNVFLLLIRNMHTKGLSHNVVPLENTIRFHLNPILSLSPQWVAVFWPIDGHT